MLVADSLAMKMGGKMGSTYNILAINPAIGCYELVLALDLLALLNGSFQDPAKGFGNENVSLIHNAVSASTALLDYA